MEIWKRRIRKRRMLRLERENSIKSRKLENRGFFNGTYLKKK